MATILSSAPSGARAAVSPEGAVPASDGVGRLVLVVGPSGAGKDSLIAYCRERLAGSDRVVFPRRVITREDAGDTEDHDTVSEDAFHRMVSEGAFALHWRAHGLGYGIPAAITADRAAARTIVVNVSRSVIDKARRRFPPVLVVSVTAPVAVLADRLSRRGRESPERVQARLERSGSYVVEGEDVLVLDNAGPIEQAGETLLAVLVAPGA
ncbi:MAG: phosphonate metabolism protein/1,5-bisphosphokinase (PRPP-forming) PhnN [Bauldia sp.]|nr:phosphonate metabolism protein/1,5-bisphosphokinase (PRPP-forming) PhnN [Bauldia sp.]